MSGKQRNAGFTLVELLLVISILSLLAGIILAVLGPVRRTARVASCTSNLRQLGVAYKIYLADYDQYPDPDVVTHGSFVNDRRILFCPADEDPPRLRAASSYIFTYFVPPDFTPLPEVRNLHPDKVLLICDHHLGPKLLEVESNEDPRVTSPQYPFHLVLRADGRVGRVHLSRIRQLPMPGSRLSFMEVYPGEPGYEQARR